MKTSGFQGSREYFYGYKLHALIEDVGLLREVHILEGGFHDLEEEIIGGISLDYGLNL